MHWRNKVLRKWNKHYFVETPLILLLLLLYIYDLSRVSINVFIFGKKVAKVAIFRQWVPGDWENKAGSQKHFHLAG